MSYTTRKGMGDTASDLIAAIKYIPTALEYGPLIVGVAKDPYLPEAICRVSQLKALSVNRTPLQAMFGKRPTVAVPSCSTTPPGRKGAGVEKAIGPLRKLVYVSQHTTAVWAGLTALLVVPMLVGYMIGRKTR